VAFAARRRERLDAAVAEAKGDAFALGLDVRDAASCDRAVAEAIDRLGGLDALIYAVGIGRPVALADAAAELWHDVFATNAIGAALVTRAALPALTGGRALYLSSVAASEDPPRAGMAPYAASKAALERLVAVWRVEQPEADFVRVTVGDTVTEFASSWDPEEIAHYTALWSVSGHLMSTALTPDHVGERIADLLEGDSPPAGVEIFAPG
jgi:NAD(P)-dependent dehydrogenase (short-subunit alcohol dehydrogenase family)